MKLHRFWDLNITRYYSMQYAMQYNMQYNIKETFSDSEMQKSCQICQPLIILCLTIFNLQPS